MLCRRLLLVALVSLCWSSRASAQATSLELSFTPTNRAQIAVWVEREDGTFMGTLALTYAVAKMGIGNRPGALQFNSGFRWPYGRREGVLPVWAYRRAAAPGAQQWKRVIFQSRIEGLASKTTSDESPDHYFCLSFTEENSGKNALDAVTCASVFSSDKGRFINDADVARNYGEPFEDTPGKGRTRTLSLTSLYPPRRDVERCAQVNTCYDHADVAAFRDHASAVMPEIDAITRATLQGARTAQWIFNVPNEWPKEARYKLFIEVNVEGDYNANFDDKSYPTPLTPANGWDWYAQQYGYAYRGQPSVVYELPFTLSGGASVTAKDPVGYGALQGESGVLTPLDARISNDPVGAKGSGADRLLSQAGVRASLLVLGGDASTCTPDNAPAAVEALKVTAYGQKREAHTWARLSFTSPRSVHPISSYVIEIKTDDGNFEQAFTPDSEHVYLPVALDMCADPNDPTKNRCLNMPAGTPLSATIAGLRELTHYTVRVSARDRTCGAIGPALLAEYKTPKQTFSTVSPCFVATAAYGSPLAGEIHVLRALRDRQLANHALGRALVRAYYAIGPSLAAPVAEHPWLARGVRLLLSPIVHFARWLGED